MEYNLCSRLQARGDLKSGGSWSLEVPDQGMSICTYIMCYSSAKHSNNATYYLLTELQEKILKQNN